MALPRYAMANPFTGPGIFDEPMESPTAKARAETQKSIEAGKAASAQRQKANDNPFQRDTFGDVTSGVSRAPAGTNPFHKPAHPFDVDPDLQSRPGFRWTVGPQPDKPAAKTTSYRGTVDPFASSDPWNPSGAALTEGQLNSDYEARKLLNRRHAQAIEAIDDRDASRPDPMAEAVSRARANRMFNTENVFANDPFAEHHVKNEGEIRANTARVQQQHQNLTADRGGFLAAMDRESQEAQRALTNAARLPEPQRSETVKRIESELDKRHAQIETAYGYRKITERNDGNSNAY